MAISVKDIQEKEFTTVANGYDMEQVDDFLDELAEQMGALIRQNLDLNGQVQGLQESLTSAQANNAEMAKKLPDYNESGYFKNLESALRESLIGAQRIADETVSEANRKAQQAIEDANAQAEKTIADADANAQAITGAAKQTVADLNAEIERLKGVVDNYKTTFRKLVNDQLAVLNQSED